MNEERGTPVREAEMDMEMERYNAAGRPITGVPDDQYLYRQRGENWGQGGEAAMPQGEDEGSGCDRNK